MRKFFKVSASLLLAVILVLVLGLLWYRQASLPAVSGQMQAAGLRQAVDVVRDAEGIPHIFAANTRDAWFSLGFLHAQDRMWQMEINRRIAAGRMAEILGPKALPTDRFLRTLGVARNAQRIWQNLDTDTQAVLNAYADGVNAWITQHGSVLPPEFLLAGAPAPEPWKPTDSLGWQTMMAWDLGANWTQEILRMRLAQRLSMQQLQAFMPPYPGDTPLPTRDFTELYRSLHASLAPLQQLAKAAPPSGMEGLGSNVWVVSGKHTASGQPLLANDPHLSLNAPALWYFAHVSAPGMDVIGATLPGLPGVVLGRNRRIAWGFTNTAPDVQDLYIERLNPGQPNQYAVPGGGWADFSVREEILRVKGQAEEKMLVRESRHGPVITGAVPLMERSGIDAGQYAVAFAWTALRADDKTVRAGIRAGLANNWEEFVATMRDFHAPQQNMMYADVDGNIGYLAPGRVPVRKAANDLHGLAPAPGWDARYDWDGFIPFEALPRSFNPPSGRLANANEKPVPPDYPYFITSEWSLPYRAQRIDQLLQGQDKHDLGSFARMQMDVQSLAAQELLPLIRKAVPLDEPSRQALSLLAHWPGQMDADAAEALIFHAWMRQLARAMFEDELGGALMKDYFEQRNVHQPMVQALAGVNGQQAWCRDIRQGAAATDCAGLLSRSLQSAMAELAAHYGSDMSKWRWGEAHQARAAHRPFSQVPALAWLFELKAASPGDTYTVNVGRYSLREDKPVFYNRHAASLRALYDLGQPEASRFIHSSGPSGNPLTPLYRSYLQRWVKGDYLPMGMERAALEQDSMGTLRLLP